MTMDIDLHRIESTGLAELAGITGLSGDFSDHPEPPAGKITPKIVRPGLIWSSAVLVAGLGAWTLLSGGPGENAAASRPVGLVTAAAPTPEPVQPLPENSVANAVRAGSQIDPATAEAITPEQPAPVDGLRILSQSWRRGGLGSNALVTLTLRNRNDYAVKDIEISCAFTRQDGSHLTDRTRMIPDTVGNKRRKKFARMHVGFVNVNADKAKCALVAASHV
jgi:hypothetical protein